jgi:hypothetical protein
MFFASIAAEISAAAMPAQAGSTGHGITPTATTHYTYCFGGGVGTAYFSPVLTSTAAAYKREQTSLLGIDFGAYLTKTLRVTNNGGQCFASETMANTVLMKKQREDELIYRKWKIVETKWTGVGSP